MKKVYKIIVFILLFISAFLLGVRATFFIIEKYPTKFYETVTKLEKDVTVTDVGIADAVEKVYDSVIVVSTYFNNQLIGTGSGFIYKISGSDAYLITNHHVVDGGNKFKITYTDGEEVDATLVGSDEYSDIGVLKVSTKDGYKAVEIGDSNIMRVGDTTFTVGAPLGEVYSWSVTRGILSGKERLVEVSLSNSYQSDYIMNVLQTDSPVNSGNSGGPISNSNGEVIGVVNAKISSSGVEGIGFAIPIEVAQEKAEEIITGNKSSKPYLGISMLNVEDARNYYNYRKYIANINVDYGVIVADIEKDSLAEKNGMKTGDIIIDINGKDIKNVAYLRYELYKYNVGDTITGTVKNVTDFGAFIDLGGVDGLLHITEMSWGKIKHPSDVMYVGDEVDVYIKAIDDEKKKISLGYKKAEDNPFVLFTNQYSVGDVATVKIMNLMPFGAFARIIDGVDGLIHISQISTKHIAKPADVLKVGDEVEVKIVDINEETQKVGLSIRALMDEAAEAEETAAVEEATEEVVAE